MGLFGKKKRTPITRPRTNSVGENLNHLTPEGDLPFGWMAYNKEIIQQMESELSVFRKAVNDAKEPLDEYAALKSFLLFLKDGKAHYTRINECAGKYFEIYICDSVEAKDKRKRFKALEQKLKTK